MRIFIGITETSGFYTRLYNGFRENNITCFYALLNSNKHNYHAEISDNFITKRCRYYYDLYIKSNDNLTKNLFKIIFNIYKFIVFIWSFFTFDTFVFTHCNCFWGVKELALYRLFRKKTVMVCLGSFTRYPFADGTEAKGIYTGKKMTTEEMVSKLAEKNKKISMIEKYSNYFINLPAQAQIGNKKFINLGQIGIPMDPIVVRNKTKHDQTNSVKKIRILHAPSYIGVRGTNEFRKVISELRDKYNIDYIEIHGKPNDVVLEEISKSDFILDELYSDTPMATFAMEAASLGKPAIIGSYFSGEYKNYYDVELLPPSMFVQPGEIKSAIIKMIEDVEYRTNLGIQAQQFVFNNYNASIVAKKFEKIINGRCPKKWIIKPSDINYIWGYGQSKNEVLQNVKKLMDKHGKDSLIKNGVKSSHLSLYMKMLEEQNGTENKKE